MLLRLRYLLLLSLLPGLVFYLYLVYLMWGISGELTYLTKEFQSAAKMYQYYRNLLYLIYLPFSLVTIGYYLVLKFRSNSKLSWGFLMKVLGILFLGLLIITFDFFLAAMTNSIINR